MPPPCDVTPQRYVPLTKCRPRFAMLTLFSNDNRRGRRRAVVLAYWSTSRRATSPPPERLTSSPPHHLVISPRPTRPPFYNPPFDKTTAPRSGGALPGPPSPPSPSTPARAARRACTAQAAAALTRRAPHTRARTLTAVLWQWHSRKTRDGRECGTGSEFTSCPATRPQSQSNAISDVV